MEADYEDRNGSLLHEESEDIYAGTGALDDVDDEYSEGQFDWDDD